MNRGAARVEATPRECALAAEMFDHFCSAGTMKQILALHREICHTLNLKPNRMPDFYPKLKAKLSSSWKAQALFKKFDARSNHKVYAKGRACTGVKVLIIGAGPCGLRAAIECQLLGAKVVVVEKRDRMSRNNVLHLWPFVIQDLRALGAKKFFGKFCAGSIDHISIRQLQCILLKVALLLGVEFHEGISFEELLEPTVTESGETLGWRARVSPANHPVAQYEFDALVGADGKRNTLQGFKRSEFRGKLAMAITANFINRHTEQEASVPEISGVAFIFNQKFFKELYEETGIDLENIVYYKDDTHYFVMTAKKHSLLDKGVLLNDYTEVSRLLSVENVDRNALMQYAREAARFSTDGRLPLKDFALNHYGEPDVALFDFSSMYTAENASMVYERHGRRLLCQLVGDSLLEPFWPTGSGCARGFLSALDAAWAVRAWGQTPSPHPLQVIAERESIYRLLGQTTPENLHRDFGAYTLDPCTRYPNLNRTKVSPHQVTSFYDSDEPLPLDAVPTPRKRRREVEVSDAALLAWVGMAEGGLRGACNPHALADVVRRYRPDLLPPGTPSRNVYHVLHHDLGIERITGSGTLRQIPEAKLRSYLTRIYNAFKGEVPHIHHETDAFDQIKQNQQKEKHMRNTVDLSISAYSNTADTDKSHSSCRKKRRAFRPQVSTDSEEYIRQKIGKLDLNDITRLARLIEGHDAVPCDEQHTGKQKELQDQILALLDPDEAPDPIVVRESIAQLLQGTTKTKVKRETQQPAKIAQFFREQKEENRVKPRRRLKGLDLSSVKIPDFSDVFDDSADTDATVVKVDRSRKDTVQSKVKEFVRARSIESPRKNDSFKSLMDSSNKKDFIRSFSVDAASKFVRSSSVENSSSKGRRLSEIIGPQRNKNSSSPELSHERSNSIGANDIIYTRRIAQLFEGHKRRHTPSPDTRSVRSGSVTTMEMTLRMKRMAELIEGKRRDTPSPERTKRTDSIGTPEMALRKQRVVDLIAGHKYPEFQYDHQRRGSGEISFRMQRANEMMAKRSSETKKPKSGGGRRKAAREIMRQRFEKSLQMLCAEPRLDVAPSTDLKNDYNLQQYRASAPHFDDRVRTLEKQLQHYEEGRIISGGGKGAGGGLRVAQLAAELAGANPSAAPRPSKPKDLMRSVGKIERDDWNVKEIERKIMENRLGRPEPKLAERVPQWDREQFLGRQRRLQEGDGSEKWGEIDETLQKIDQKLRDSGRPDHGTKKVASLATKFVKKEETEPRVQPKEFVPQQCKKSWRGPASTGMQCAACGSRVFAAEGVTADGLHLHRACFRCAVCKCVLRPGNYTMERCGSRLVCLRHSGVSVPDAAAAVAALGVVTSPGPSARVMQPLHPPPTPERISLELSDSGAKEIDEDEWTDRNFLASETSGAGGLSDEDESSSEDYGEARESDNGAERSPEPEPQTGVRPRPARDHLYFSDDSFGYDDYSDEGAESSGNESCSRMRAAREARRREVPAAARPPTDSSEVESEEESSSSEEEEDEEVSSATEVSTDSEFAREEPIAPALAPPAILVTEAPPQPYPARPQQDYPLNRTRSAGGLATKRALELKRRYLLGEPSTPAVRKSDSTSQLDTKLEAFRSHITEFQKMLHPAPAPYTQTQKLVVTFQLSTEEKKIQPMPDIIRNLVGDAPVDLLTKADSPLCKKNWRQQPVDCTANENAEAPGPEPEPEPEAACEPDLDSDSLSEDDSSHTETAPNQAVPRVEVHDEGGELIQLDSLTLVSGGGEEAGTASGSAPTVLAADHAATVDDDSSESGHNATTLALTETELSDWAAESAVLDDCHLDDDRKRSKIPRALSGPKSVHDAKNIAAISGHVCGRPSSPPPPVLYSNALDHFEFVDEGEQDPSIETPVTPRNEGYMELVDDDYDAYSPANDRSIDFIERDFSETVAIPVVPIEPHSHTLDDDSPCTQDTPLQELLITPQLPTTIDNEVSEIVNSESAHTSDTNVRNTDECSNSENAAGEKENKSLSDISPPLEKSCSEAKSTPPKSIEIVELKPVSISDVSPPLAAETPQSALMMSSGSKTTLPFSTACSLHLYSPAICRSASDTFHRSTSRSTDSPSRSAELSVSITISSGSVSPSSQTPLPSTGTAADKVQEIKREREEQTEVVRRLVLERLGAGGAGGPGGARGGRRSTRRSRASPGSGAPPPVPPPPALFAPPPPPPPPPPRPDPPHIPLPVTPSFSDPELARERRRKSIMKSISNYLNRRLGPRQKEPEASPARGRMTHAHKSTSALQDAPPVPPPPASYRPSPPAQSRPHHAGAHTVDVNVAWPGVSIATTSGCVEERDAMQLWFEARWARLVAQRRAREDPSEPHSRRVARLERRLTRPLSAEQQAATVAELVQVSAQRQAHKALMAADRRRSGGGD